MTGTNVLDANVVDVSGSLTYTVGRELSTGLYLDPRESDFSDLEAVQADCDARNLNLSFIAGDDPTVLEPEIPFRVYQVSRETTVYVMPCHKS
jgi:hypothetical protein